MSRRRLGTRRYAAFAPVLIDLALTAESADPPRLAGEFGRDFAQAAINHGVGGQVLRAARRGRVVIDATAQRELEAAQATRMVTSALLRAEVSDVRRVIAHATTTEPVLIKGPAVADRFYDDAEDRCYADLDFLLPPAAIAPSSAELVAGLGYRAIEPPWPARLQRHGHALELERTRGVHTLPIELHWRISDDPAADTFDHAQVRARAQRWPHDPGVLVPDLPSQLLLLAVHLVHHAHRSLSWLIDLHRISEAADEEQWREAFSLADALGLGWVLHVALDDVEQVTKRQRRRPSQRPAPVPWGPLRVARILSEEPFGYHAGQLAMLSWRDRRQYLMTGARGVLSRALRRLPARAR